MKLTIQNYNKIVREWANITIAEIIESEWHYRFRCQWPGSTLDYWVTLSRQPMNTMPGQYAFPFLTEYGQETQGVSTDWFSDMDNAVSVITDEFKRIYNEHNP